MLDFQAWLLFLQACRFSANTPGGTMREIKTLCYRGWSLGGHEILQNQSRSHAAITLLFY